MTYISGYHSNIHSPCLLIQGGENDEGETLSDCWIMELHTAAWKHVRVYIMYICNYVCTCTCMYVCVYMYMYVCVVCV